MLWSVAIIIGLLIVNWILVLSKLSCNDVKKKGSGAAFDLEELKTLSEISAENLDDCFIFLGKEPLIPQKASTIWSSIINVYGSPADIPEERLQQLRWISAGVPSDHFSNLTLTDVDTVAAFGKLTYLSKQQMDSLKEAVMEQWCGKNEEDLTSFDLATLKQIICAFNSTSIQMIHPISYKAAASELSTLINCSEEVIRELARLATSQEAFGDPSTWTSIQVANVGCVISGLDAVSIVPATAIDGITPDIVKCLPKSILQAMTEEQVRNLAPVAASAVSKEQRSVLDKNKQYALEQAIIGLGSKESGSGIISSSLPLINLISFISLSRFFL